MNADLRKATNTYPKVCGLGCSQLDVLRVGTASSLSNLGKRDLVGDGAENHWLQRPCVQMENIYTVKQCSIVPRQSNLSVPIHDLSVQRAGVISCGYS